MLCVLDSGLMLFDISMKIHEDILNGSRYSLIQFGGEQTHRCPWKNEYVTLPWRGQTKFSSDDLAYRVLKLQCIQCDSNKMIIKDTFYYFCIKSFLVSSPWNCIINAVQTIIHILEAKIPRDFHLNTPFGWLTKNNNFNVGRVWTMFVLDCNGVNSCILSYTVLGLKCCFLHNIYDFMTVICYHWYVFSILQE